MTGQEDDKLVHFYEAYYNKANDLSDQQLHRSAQSLLFEGKRFAKTNRLLIAYITACFSITNNAQALLEPEIGIDNAMELIAYLESPEKCRKFQNDYDEDHYQYLVSQLSACAYDNLAVHTALRLGYNSPTVFGAVDDGIQVCRRTGKLECVECFREYATRISLASGDYEMGEHHARQCATSTARDRTDDRRYIGHKDLVHLFIRQGKLQAAFDICDVIFPFAEKYHDPLDAKFTSALDAEKLFWLAGKENELPQFLADHKLNDLPKVPPREEWPDYHINATLCETVKMARQERWLDAVQSLDQCEQFLAAQDLLNPWFDIRIAKIANLLLAKKHGLEIAPRLDHYIAELKSRANEAHHWSAIQAVHAMEEERVPLNPLGIAFPIDLGPYATAWTIISSAKLGLMLPIVDISTSLAEVVQDSGQATPAVTDVKTPIQEKAEQMYAVVLALADEQREYYKQLMAGEIELEDGEFKPYPRAEELAAKELDYLVFAESFHPDDETRLTLDEFLDVAKPLSELSLLENDPQIIERVWKWHVSFRPNYPDSARLLAHYALTASFLENNAMSCELDPQSIGMPGKETYFKWIEQAFALDPNNHNVATIAGLLYRGDNQYREARRYFSRACQLDRLNEFATDSLCDLYEVANRPNDALATIELYVRAGGRHPHFLWRGTEITFQNDLANEFILYYDAFTKETQPDIQLQAEHLWALVETEQYGDVLTELDHIDEVIQYPSRDRLYLRAYCLAKTGKPWTDCFETALNLVPEEEAIEGIPGIFCDPCGPLWDFVSLWPNNDPRRQAYEQFIMLRGLAPMSFFDTDSQDTQTPDVESDDPDAEQRDCKQRTDKAIKTLYQCTIRQPLSPQEPAYAGWNNISPSAPHYITNWFVLADDPEEAMKIAIQWQQKCYGLAPEPDECVPVDQARADHSRVFAQGKRQWEEEANDDTDEIGETDNEWDDETDE